MKKYINISILILTIGCTASKTSSLKQNAIQKEITQSKDSVLIDTFGYIKNIIIKNKQQFIGQPFDSLLSNIPYSIASYSVVISGLRKYNQAITISFTSAESTSRDIMANRRPVLLSIAWDKPLLLSEAYAQRASTKGAWTDQSKEYFKSYIVKDVVLGYDGY